MAQRQGAPARLAPKWPCRQTEDASPAGFCDELAAFALGLAGRRRRRPPPLEVPGRAFALDERPRQGTAGVLIFAPIWAILRPEGSLHLALRPEWAQKVGLQGLGNRASVRALHGRRRAAAEPGDLRAARFARARDSQRIVEAAHAYAMGRIGTVALPDSRW